MSERILEDFEPGELTCQELAELVSDYIEGVLAPPVQEEIVAHLAECSDCTAYVEQVRTTIAVAGEIGERRGRPAGARGAARPLPRLGGVALIDVLTE